MRLWGKRLSEGKSKFLTLGGLTMDEDEPIPSLDPPTIRRCAVCGETASYRFGPPGGSSAAEARYCAGHRDDGERLWTARYRSTGGFGGSLL